MVSVVPSLHVVLVPVQSFAEMHVGIGITPIKIVLQQIDLAVFSVVHVLFCSAIAEVVRTANRNPTIAIVLFI